MKKLRQMRGFSQYELARILGVSRSRIAMYEQGRAEPDTEMLRRLAELFGVTVDYLLSSESPLNRTSPPDDAIPAVLVPVLGVIRAGEPIFAEQNILGYLHAPAGKLNPAYEHFFLRVEGDSMSGDGILPGDFVLVRKQDHAEDGDIVVVIVNGDEATIKRLRLLNGHIALVPSNPEYRPAVYPPEEVIIIGKVLMVVRDLN